MRSRLCLVLSIALAMSLTLPAQATAATANHLLISEVVYDTVDESGEAIEILNPTDVDVVLNDGTAAFFLSDDVGVYFDVVNGDVANTQTTDWVIQFPMGATIPAHSFIVVTGDSDAFANNFYAGDLQAFYGQPGAPQLFEMTSDADAVPDMLVRGTSTVMSLTNSSESLVLFSWDGISDLVQDVDHVVWGNNNSYFINKTGVSVDGPDADTLASTYLDDAASGTLTSDAPQGLSLQRHSTVETGELESGGNGLTGNDESTEDWSATFSANHAPSLGSLLLSFDGNIEDVMALGAPLAVSAADGSSSASSPRDFGADGTITELYAFPIDEDGDGTPDVLWVALRGEFFGTDTTVNGTFVAIDAMPGSALGYSQLESDGVMLADTTGTLDDHITNAGITLDAALISAGIAFDAVAGATAATCATDEECGLRGLGTDSIAGAQDDFAWLTASTVRVGLVDASIPGATGTSYAAPHSIEMRIPLADLGNPAVVALAAFSSGDASAASPNTLPENSGDTFDVVQTIEEVVYVLIGGETCNTDAECAPCNVCDTFQCVPVADDTTCDDGSLCTTGDICTAGVCSGATPDCSGLDTTCAAGACNPADGACIALPTNEGGGCDDALFCTESDMCVAGFCVGAAVDCSAQDGECAVGTCDMADGTCYAAPFAEGDPCEDGDLCTTGETCTGGTCGGSAAVDCSGLDDVCNAGMCDGSDGTCYAAPANDGGGCDDGDLCTDTDVCSGGGCAGGSKDCSAEDGLCVVGTCNALSGACEAINVADDTVCDDSDLCTDTDVCTAGTCAGTALDCAAMDDACNAYSCDAGTGSCVATTINEGGGCDDSDLCTDTDICTAGVCAGGNKDCTAFDAECVVGTCNATSGVCEAVASGDGDSCDDGDTCTENDTCGGGTCAGTALDCAAMNDACNAYSCDTGTGTCVSTAINDGGACDDEDLCTDTGVCDAGACLTDAVDCSSFDGACVVGVCESSDGSCTTAPANEGGGCNDGSLCTDTDVCTAGVCAGALKDCSAENGVCLVGTCNDTTGTCEAVSAADDTPCDDSDLCTDTDVCTSGTCAGDTVDCSAEDGVCLVGTCNAATGVCEAALVADDTECDDSNPCTESDVCTSGTCDGTPVAAGTECGDQCNTGVCNATTGACDATPIADDTECDDDNACTGNDVCTSGVCGGAAVADDTSCDDDDLCTDFDVCTAGICEGTTVDCTHLDDACNTGTCVAGTRTCEAIAMDDDTECDDQDACTEDDVCTAGVCEGAAVADDTTCDDDNACTDGDVCTAGVCSGVGLDCTSLDDGCNVGSCDAESGACVATPVADDTACDDGDPCTGPDACITGSCISGENVCTPDEEPGSDVTALLEPTPDMKGGGCECQVRTTERDSGLPFAGLLFAGLAAVFMRRRRR